MKYLKCIFRLHKWFYPTHSTTNKDLPNRRCTLCGRREEATYDMSTGDTLWNFIGIN